MRMRCRSVLGAIAGWAGVLSLAVGCAGTSSQSDDARNAPAAAVSGDRVDLRVIPSEEFVADRVAGITGVVEAAEALAAADGATIDARDVEFFRNSELGREWLTKRLHRAVSSGYPAKRCPYHYVAWEAATRSEAIERALRQCLNYVQNMPALGEGRQTHCGCRLVALDNLLLVPPAELSYRNLVPALLLRNKLDDKEVRSAIPGFFEFSGRAGTDLPIRMVSREGYPLCEGTYSTTRPAEGVLKLICDLGVERVNARFRVFGFHEGRAYGVALGRSDLYEYVGMFGLTEENFVEIHDRLRSIGPRL